MIDTEAREQALAIVEETRPDVDAEIPVQLAAAGRAVVAAARVHLAQGCVCWRRREGRDEKQHAAQAPQHERE